MAIPDHVPTLTLEEAEEFKQRLLDNEDAVFSGLEIARTLATMFYFAELMQQYAPIAHALGEDDA